MAGGRNVTAPTGADRYSSLMGHASRRKNERRVARSHPDLLQSLQEQFRFLVRASAHFDEGDEAEAKNLAVVLRKLLHDKGQSVSLLTQLHERERLRYIDTAPPVDPKNLLPMCGLAAQQILPDETGAWWLATLEQQPPQRTGRMSPFPAWWRNEVTRDARSTSWSREGLVLVVAEQDGGAHVDPKLDETYHALSRENGMGWRFHPAGADEDDDGVPFLGDPVLASIRQIAWEFEWTLRLFLWKELGLSGPQSHRFRPPDSESADERWRRGELERMPSISFRVTVDGGASGKRLKLTHPPNFQLKIREAPTRVPESR